MSESVDPRGVIPSETNPLMIYCDYRGFYWHAQCHSNMGRYESLQRSHGSAKQAADEVLSQLRAEHGATVTMKRRTPKLYEAMLPVLIAMLLLCGCGSIESMAPEEPVTVLWPTEKFTNNYAAEYLWPQNMKWWAFEAGFGSDGRVYWRTNTEYDRIFGEFWEARDKAGLDR